MSVTEVVQAPHMLLNSLGIHLEGCTQGGTRHAAGLQKFL